MNKPFVSPCLPPEGLTRELLEILAEEAAEVIQRTTKILRFGLPETQPGQPLTNAQRLAREVGDFWEVLDRLVTLGVLDETDIAAGSAHKARQLDKYLQNRPEEPRHDAQPSKLP